MRYQVCLNGHRLTESYSRKFCSTCGAETTDKCPRCSHRFWDDYIDGLAAIGFQPPVPTHCESCGNSFPWAEKKQELSAEASGGTKANSFQLVEHMCSRFHLIAKQLRTRHDDRGTLIVEDEHDVQDLLHALLHLYFDDIRPEEWTPSYAGGCSRVDFLLKDEKIVLEVKTTRRTLKAKDVGEELIIDSQRYRTHPDCKKLLCFVYDADGWISNPRGLENDLSKKEENFEIKVLIVPKGH